MVDFTIRKCDSGEFEKITGEVVDSEFKRKANYLIAESVGKLVGKLGYIENFLSGVESHLFGGIFRSEIECCGIGSALISALENEALKLNIHLIIHKFSDNSGFYKKMGYFVDNECNEAYKFIS